MKPDASTPQWRSLSQLAGQPAVEERPVDPSIDELPEDGPSRRRFMQIMGASTALAAVSAGCQRWEKEEIVPEARRPDGYVPGIPKRYASAMELGGAAIGVLVTAYDGRPVKIEGNPQHPYLGGGSTVFAQASVLEMYDPDRSQTVTRQGSGATWADVEQVIAGWSKTSKLRILAEASSSPTLHRLRAQLTAGSAAKWYEWEPLSRDHERAGTAMAFGTPVRPFYDLAKARIIVALDADLFVDHPAALAHARGYASTRRPGAGELSRLYSVEAAFTATGAAADHRLPLRSEHVLPFLMALDARISGGKEPANAVFLGSTGVRPFLDAVAEDVKANPGRSVFIVGAGQPPAAHALAAKLNAPATATHAVRYAADPDPTRPSHVDSIVALVDEMKSGAVDALLILGGNPVWNAPADLGFADALAKVPTSLHLSLYQDETSARCTWHLPRAHYLESWGDAQSWDGTYSVVQPVIEPLYTGRTAIEVVSLVLGNKVKNGRELVRTTFDGLGGAGGETGWRQTLHDGFLASEPGDAPTLQAFPLTEDSLEGRQTSNLDKRANGELEVVFTASPRTYDGRFANLAWLQELPEYLSKLTWDNAAFVGPHTAQELGINSKVGSQSGPPHFDMIKIEVGGRSVTMPAYVLPGIAKYSVVVSLGHGRTRAGRVAGTDVDGVDPVGFDAYPLRSSKALWSAGNATVNTTGDTFVLASTQDHWNIDPRGRATVVERIADLARDFDVATGKFPGAFEHEAPPPHPTRGLSLWKEHSYDGYKWGMAIDLGVCIGCNACVIACQAENNVPVVGKERVLRSREMHWLRIDTYFRGNVDNPQVVHQPLTCQQCENAPCEQVCPVGATVHSDEGLNDMTYNRCVGTRYCMNNCIYRVRRFNFFAYDDEQMPGGARDKVRKLLFNPEVTVRSRGVMEKCTFCVQRIQNVKIQATNDGRRVRDGEIVTACQQACPSGAIVFGDLNDKDSEVATWHADKRAYAMMSEFNAKPRNLFLGRVRNLHPTLAKV